MRNHTHTHVCIHGHIQTHMNVDTVTEGERETTIPCFVFMLKYYMYFIDNLDGYIPVVDSHSGVLNMVYLACKPGVMSLTVGSFDLLDMFSNHMTTVVNGM